MIVNFINWRSWMSHLPKWTTSEIKIHIWIIFMIIIKQTKESHAFRDSMSINVCFSWLPCNDIHSCLNYSSAFCIIHANIFFWLCRSISIDYPSIFIYFCCFYWLSCHAKGLLASVFVVKTFNVMARERLWQKIHFIVVYQWLIKT